MKRILLTLILVSVWQIASASVHFYASVAGGMSYPRRGNGSLGDSLGNTDELQNFNFGSDTGVYSIGAGFNFRYGQLGFAFSQRVNKQGSGTYVNEDKSERAYFQDVSSTRFLLIQRVFLAAFHTRQWSVSTFLQFGEGIANNKLGTMIIPASDGIPLSLLNGKSIDSFTYQLGAGIYAKLNAKVNFFLEYLHVNSGNFSGGNIATAGGTTAPIPRGPEMGKLITDDVLAGVVYNF